MKKYSSFRMFIEYILIGFSTYLILSLVICIIGGYTYREVLCHPMQFAGLVLIYWWIPVIRMCDMDDHNDSLSRE
jgi:hypothetical protein